MQITAFVYLNVCADYTPLLVALEKHQPGHPVDDRSKIIKLLIEADASLSAKVGLLQILKHFEVASDIKPC